MLKRLSNPTILSFIIILFAGILTRIAFHQINYMPPIAPDSIGYYARAQQFYQHPSLKTFIGTARTPVFPLLMALPFLIRNEFNAPLKAGSQLQGVYDVIAIQHAASILSALLFFYVLSRLRFRRSIQLLASLLLATNMLIIPWEWAILTESWAAIWAVWYLAACILFMKHPTGKNSIVLSAILVIGIFLRPALLPLGALTPVLMALFLSKTKAKIRTVFILFFVLATVGLYTILNGIIHKNYVFQSVSSINIMGRILNHNIPVTKTADTVFGRRVLLYRNNGYALDPSALIDNTPTFPTFDSSLQSFVNRTIMAYPIPILQSILLDTRETVFAISTGIRVNPAVISVPIAQWLATIQSIDQLILSISIIVTPLLVLPLIFHRRKFPHAILAIVGISLIAILFPTILYGYEDYPRFLVPYIPLYLVLFGYLLEQIMSKIEQLSP